MQRHRAELVPDATQVTTTNSGHDFNIERPQLVIDAVHQAVDAWRARKRQVA